MDESEDDLSEESSLDEMPEEPFPYEMPEEMIPDDTPVKPKRQRISFHLLSKRNLPPDIQTSEDQEIIMSGLNELTHVRLDREHITDIDGLELLGPKVKCLYLQKNSIKAIENLEYLPNLRFLTLQNNQISCIENLSFLNHLGFLDLSFNLIESFNEDELPKSLMILSLKDNPCTSNAAAHRKRLIQSLPKLSQLDSVEISREEKREAGLEIDGDSESEEDEIDDDDDEEEEETQVDVSIELRGAAAPSVPHYEEDMSELRRSMVSRSHARLHEALSLHRTHMDELEQIRADSALPPTSAR